jgi:hypothetical protein
MVLPRQLLTNKQSDSSLDVLLPLQIKINQAITMHTLGIKSKVIRKRTGCYHVQSIFRNRPLTDCECFKTRKEAIAKIPEIEQDLKDLKDLIETP